MSRELVPKEVLAEWLGVTSRRIEQLTSDGVLEKIKENRRVHYDLKDSVKRYIKYTNDRALGKDRSSIEANLKEQKLRAEIALKESQGELHKLRTEIATGNYISVEEVQSDYSSFFVIFKNFALSIPSKVAGRLAGFVDPVEVRELESDLQKEVKNMLNNFIVKANTREITYEEKDVLKAKKRGRPRKNGS